MILQQAERLHHLTHVLLDGPMVHQDVLLNLIAILILLLLFIILVLIITMMVVRRLAQVVYDRLGATPK